MKQEWSNKWVGSKQPRKQRKYRHNAPLHIKHKFLSAHLSPELRKRFGKRAVPLRKGDEVQIMNGESAGLRGKVERINLKESKVFVDGIKVKKVDGSEVLRALQPSNLKIVVINLDDKKRLQAFERAKPKTAHSAKPEEKEGKK